MNQDWPHGTPTSGKYLVACSECGKERWLGKTQITRAKYKGLCQNCSRSLFRGPAHPFWKDGRSKSGRYIRLRLWREDFFHPMTGRGGYVPEHRLVMAKSLGRCLQTWEVVHHKDGDGKNNKLSNLELSTNGSHSLQHSRGYKHGYQQGLYDGHQEKVRLEVVKIHDWLEAYDGGGYDADMVVERLAERFAQVFIERANIERPTAGKETV